MEYNWKGFKSGTDVRGYGCQAVGDPLYLSNEAVMRMTKGYVVWLREKTLDRPLTIAVGHDSRVSSERIDAAVTAALLEMGVCVKSCGMASTPAMFMTTVMLGCDGAVQITASHHPMDKNGLKFFTPQGGLEGADVAQILSLAEANTFLPAELPGKTEPVDFMQSYAALLRRQIIEGIGMGDKPLEGFKIAVDAGNGVGGFYARDVLSPLGADVSGSRFLEPDGTFPNHAANPEDKTAMRMASEATVKSGADLGIVFDTDVDRAGCVDANGVEINRNRLVALAAAIALEDCPGGTIVTDSVTSDGLHDFILAHGGKHLRFKRGYKNVIDKMIELNAGGEACPLAMETSGHAAFRQNYNLDDGAYLMTQIVIRMARMGRENLSAMLDSLAVPKEEQEVRFRILDADFRAAGERFIRGWTAYASALDGYTAAPDNYEGIRFSTDTNAGDGWILARLSVHDPVIVINAESNSVGGVRRMLDVLNAFSKEDPALDISKLTAFLAQ
ncbi:MAG: phosphomannomutase/phosphoglucomutase [Clostridia bacterium]|nr:phosphomannomutase/phosphoglucomutase [Clostridia bacterium]